MNMTTDLRGESHATVAGHAPQALNRRKRRILIVDNDLGFLIWLGGILVEAGYTAFPADGVESATALAKHLANDLEALAVNPRIRRIAELVTRLRSCHPGLKVIALLDRGQTKTIPSVDGSLQKPSEKDSDKGEVIRLFDHLLLSPYALRAEAQPVH